MGKKYRVVCLAITDRLGNMHRNQEITYEGAKAVVKDTILDESDFDPEQIKSYLAGGHIEEHKVKSSQKVSEGDDDLTKLKEQYLELSGKERVPGTWGAAKLKEKIAELTKE